MARVGDIDAPTMAVFDLDPGPGVVMEGCAEVGLWVRDTLAGIGIDCYPKTSGSKGLQVYVPLNAPHTHEHASSFALAVAQVLERAHPSLIVTTQAKEARRGKILIDWSQNSRHKTTICVYSLRARPRPTVSTPVTWDEVEAAAGGEPLSFEAAEVLDRVERLGDLFATLTRVQHLPDPARVLDRGSDLPIYGWQARCPAMGSGPEETMPELLMRQSSPYGTRRASVLVGEGDLYLYLEDLAAGPSPETAPVVWVANHVPPPKNRASRRRRARRPAWAPAEPATPKDARRSTPVRTWSGSRRVTPWRWSTSRVRWR